MNIISGYAEILAVGHKLLGDYFDSPVIIEEKIDGSQFSFSKIDGKLACRSKNKQLDLDNPEKLFTIAIQKVKEIEDKLMDGLIYRGEYLSKPKHNVLNYGQIPTNNIIVFDINDGIQSFLSPEEKKAEATRVGFDTVPVIFQGKINNKEELLSLLDTKSCLGDVKIEGMVIKNYDKWLNKKVIFAKYVSEAFKEVHKKEWKAMSAHKTGLVENLVERYKTEARWLKAIRHLEDDGQLTNTPKDIGILMKEISEDVHKEESEYIINYLMKMVWPQVSRGIVRGFPEWYKKRLLESNFKLEE